MLAVVKYIWTHKGEVYYVLFMYYVYNQILFKTGKQIKPELLTSASFCKLCKSNQIIYAHMSISVDLKLDSVSAMQTLLQTLAMMQTVVAHIYDAN